MYKLVNRPLKRNFVRLHEAAMMASANRSVRSPPGRRFAPLSLTVDDETRESFMALKAIVFDVDGTMCLPQNYMFGEMRRALGIEKPTDILEHIESLPSGESEVAMEKVKAIEREAMTKQSPQPGLKELMEYLDSRDIPKAICTRNFNGPVEHLLNKFLSGIDFSPVITRDFKPPKPDPAGILHIAEELSVQKETLKGTTNEAGVKVLPMIMVGDSIDDMLAGNRAGAATVLLVNPENEYLVGHECTDLAISRLDELIDILEKGFASRREPET